MEFCNSLMRAVGLGGQQQEPRLAFKLVTEEGELRKTDLPAVWFVAPQFWKGDMALYPGMPKQVQTLMTPTYIRGLKYGNTDPTEQEVDDLHSVLESYQVGDYYGSKTAINAARQTGVRNNTVKTRITKSPSSLDRVKAKMGLGNKDFDLYPEYQERQLFDDKNKMGRTQAMDRWDSFVNKKMYDEAKHGEEFAEFVSKELAWSTSRQLDREAKQLAEEARVAAASVPLADKFPNGLAVALDEGQEQTGQCAKEIGCVDEPEKPEKQQLVPTPKKNRIPEGMLEGLAEGVEHLSTCPDAVGEELDSEDRPPPAAAPSAGGKKKNKKGKGKGFVATSPPKRRMSEALLEALAEGVESVASEGISVTESGSL